MLNSSLRLQYTAKWISLNENGCSHFNSDCVGLLYGFFIFFRWYWCVSSVFPRQPQIYILMILGSHYWLQGLLLCSKPWFLIYCPCTEGCVCPYWHIEWNSLHIYAQCTERQKDSSISYLQKCELCKFVGLSEFRRVVVLFSISYLFSLCCLSRGNPHKFVLLSFLYQFMQLQQCVYSPDGFEYI